MNSERILRIIFFIEFFLLVAVRGYYGWKIRRAGGSNWSVKEEAVEREGRWSILLRFFLFLYMLAAVLLYAVNPAWLNSFAMPLPIWSRWVGMGLGAASIPLLIWVHHTLGKHWSTNLQLREEHALVTSGPYRWIRHPMYTAIFTFFVGLLLISAIWLIVPLVVASILVLYARLGKEEAMMIEQFGDTYRAYMRRTGRLLPRFIHGSD